MQTPNFLILGPQHAEQAAQLEAQCFSQAWPLAQWQESLTSSNFYAYGLFLHEHLVAYVSLFCVLDEAEICNVGTLPQSRGQGHAKNLLQYSLLDCRKKVGQSLHIVLEVRPSNASAIALYASLGFQLCGKRKQYYADTGEDALIMELTLV